jgi:thiamine biosynthesis lipoprotein
MAAPGSALYTYRFPLMGGEGSLDFVDARGEGEARRAARAAENEARRVEVKFSRYRETSVVSEINRNAGRTPVAVDEETESLVRSAIALSESTGGRFDPTVGVLRLIWDFKGGRVPSSEEVDALLPFVDAGSVRVRNGTVFLPRAGMEIDLGGVGKEYAADRAAAALRESGVRCGIVNFAGDVRTIGCRGDGGPWRVGVTDPRRRGSCRFAVFVLGEAGVATSGDYERGFVRDGVRYHHILDAKTGWPARGVASVTVVAATAARAGSLATAAFLLGPERGLALLEETRGAEGALILESGAIRATGGMRDMSDLPEHREDRLASV